MEKEIYFKLTELNAKPSFILTPINILRLKEGKLESITSTQEEIKNIEFAQNENGEYSVKKGYKIKEISEEEAKKSLREREIYYAHVQNYFSSSGNYGSSILRGNGGDRLL